MSSTFPFEVLVGLSSDPSFAIFLFLELCFHNVFQFFWD
jgi:hypothetical protein